MVNTEAFSSPLQCYTELHDFLEIHWCTYTVTLPTQSVLIKPFKMRQWDSLDSARFRSNLTVLWIQEQVKGEIWIFITWTFMDYAWWRFLGKMKVVVLSLGRFILDKRLNVLFHHSMCDCLIWQLDYRLEQTSSWHRMMNDETRGSVFAIVGTRSTRCSCLISPCSASETNFFFYQGITNMISLKL